MARSICLMVGLVSFALTLACTRGRPPRVAFPGELAHAVSDDAKGRNLVHKAFEPPLWLLTSGVAVECRQVSCGSELCETRCRADAEGRRDVKRLVRVLRRQFGREQYRSGRKWCSRVWRWRWQQEGALRDERFGLIELVCDRCAGDSEGFVLRFVMGSESPAGSSTCPCAP